MPKRFLYLLSSLSFALSASAQTPSQQVTVDAYLKLTFPGRVNRSDNNVSIFLNSTVNHTTYYLLRMKVRQEISETQLGEFMNELARRKMADQQYDGLTKQMTDSVVGGAKGPFVKMKRPDQTKPLFDYMFITIRGANIYLLMSSSSKPEANALEDARHFFEKVIFKA
jgi:hypothetical protein